MNLKHKIEKIKERIEGSADQFLIVCATSAAVELSSLLLENAKVISKNSIWKNFISISEEFNSGKSQVLIVSELFIRTRAIQMGDDSLQLNVVFLDYYGRSQFEMFERVRSKTKKLLGV